MHLWIYQTPLDPVPVPLDKCRCDKTAPCKWQAILHLKQEQEGQEIYEHGLETLWILEEERVMGWPWSHCKGCLQCPLLSYLSGPAIHLAFQYWQSDLFKAKCKLCTQAFVGMWVAAILPSLILSQQKTGKLLISSIFIWVAQLLTFMIASFSVVKNVSWFSQGKKGIKQCIMQNPCSQIKINTWYWITGLRAHMF